MSAFFILIGASLLVAIGFLSAFLWSAADGQFDDDYTPSVRILLDNNTAATEDKTEIL
jgi:cbb3-type cytochrome oxidase maturation protein